MSAAPARDWCDLPLAGDGRCLIEASAGTGKTWTIAALYLRLLLECGWLPPQIVVTTFGVAAAQELGERVRARVLGAATLAEIEAGRDAQDVPAYEAKAGDAIDAWLRERWRGDRDRVVRDRNRLRLALAELDLAPITTLHGLCGRVLSEHPFESGGGFVPGELVSGETLDREIRDDLWRRLAQSEADALDAGDRAWFAGGRKAFDAALRRVCAPGVGVRAVPLDRGTLDDVLDPRRAGEIRTWCASAPFKTVASVMRRGLATLAAFLESGDPYAPWPKGMAEDLRKPIETQFKPAFVATARACDVIVFVQRALAVLELAVANARATALARHRETLLAQRGLRLRERDRLTFDALIERTGQALAGELGDRLAAGLRETWPVALVDEFQDTDAQQYAILDRIYRDPQHAPRGRLVMIGDPKQAIYRFRGGDIDAYLAARDDATDTLRLSVNFRSSPSYVEACNELFTLAGPALSQVDERIAYEPATAGAGDRHDALTCDDVPCARPLAFHVLGAGTTEDADDAGTGGTGDGRTPVGENATRRREHALRACANQIVQALQERRHRIGGRLLEPGDLAVLLPRNDDIARLRVLLGERGVPCVGAGTQGVFQTDTARELLVLLHGIEHANEEPSVRAALATRFFALGFDALRALADDDARWQLHVQRFAAWRSQWRSEGVQAVIQSVCAASARQLAAGANAERALTDLRHLGELLQQAAAECDGPASLLAWFARQRAGDADTGEEAAEEQQLRIESDARRVRLMTLHRSKGLEFPMVFLPLLWAVRGARPALPLVRDEGSPGRVVDIGGPLHEAAVLEDMQAEQDERFRVLYVALTRAQHACHVYAVEGTDEEPDPGRSALAALLARVRARLQGGDPSLATTRIDWSDAGWPWTKTHWQPLARAPRPQRQALPAPPPRPFLARHSFSTLSSHRPASDEDAADDEHVPAVEGIDGARDDGSDAPVHPELAALSEWRGTAFGNALHAILEQRAHGRPLREQLDLVRQSLDAFGVRVPGHGSDALVRRLAARLQGLLDASLPIGAAPLPTLSGLAPQRQRAEMEFHYALEGVSLQRLRAACAAWGEPDLVPAQAPSTLRGLMNGKIDLVFEHAGRFHVLDYKGNFLGERIADYAPEALRAAMDLHHYRFQALLYTVALDRYLAGRIAGYARERQLGEAVYAFVRAVGLAPGVGLWTHRFEYGLVEAAGAVLASRPARETA